MRILTLICLLFCLVNYSFGQDTTRKQNVFGKYSSWAEFNVAHHNPIFVVDNNMIADTLVTKALKNLDAASVLELNIVKDSLPATVYAQQPLREVVLVVTKAYAAIEIQKRFASISKSYEKYIELHKNEDLGYVINGIWSEGTSDDTLKRLYDLPVKKIKFVGVLDKDKVPGVIRSAVVITTKE
jgi:hypothetical protein